MSSRFGTGGIPILATIMERVERPEVEKAEGGVKSDDASRLAWADWSTMQTAGGSPLWLEIIGKRRAGEKRDRPCVVWEEGCCDVPRSGGLSEDLLRRRNSAVMLTPHQPERQWVTL